MIFTVLNFWVVIVWKTDMVSRHSTWNSDPAVISTYIKNKFLFSKKA